MAHETKPMLSGDVRKAASNLEACCAVVSFPLNKASNIE